MAIRQSSVVTPVLVLLSAMNLLGCSGGSSSGGSSGGSTGPPNPTAAIDAISPNSSPQGGPSFTLSVVGSNFISDSSVQWNGSSLPTTFVSNALLTAAIPASAIAAPGPDAVAVANPAPGGGASAALNFAVPCVIPSSAPASGQTSARLGAYYFDGWSGPLTNFHFQGLPLGPYQDRQELFLHDFLQEKNILGGLQNRVYAGHFRSHCDSSSWVSPLSSANRFRGNFACPSVL